MIDNSYIEYIEGAKMKNHMGTPPTMQISKRYYSSELVKHKIHPVAPYSESEFLMLDLDENEEQFEEDDEGEVHYGQINEDDHSEYSMAMQRDDDEGMGDDEQLGGIATEYDNLTM